ncbi:HEAT repeat domain-containing protein [Metallumcola ferriviriculae]|uniref:HEAT repeat domain-containing protein n=1 Tax=Metallumcola ferriviriculae TaxID=3039180 RepID=A0AAU0UQ88_9FIRM|nr:HEAT repeat domain-containing protein [Desulfitibacteraceae bacterium MK1]
MISNIKLGTQRIDGELRETISASLLKLLTEDWGGPKNPMAQNYYRQVVIPELLNCLEINLHTLLSPVFSDILAKKLNTQFGFPPTFATGLAGDIIASVGEDTSSLPQADLYEPWERLFRMLSIGEAPVTIAERTAFAQEYVELIRKNYRQFIKLITEHGQKSFESFAQTEFIECDEQLLHFMYKFWQRFEDPHYLERLKAEDIAYQMGLNMEPTEILASLVVIHDFEGQVDKNQLLELLKYGNSRQGKKLELLTGCLPLQDYSYQDVEYFVERMLSGGYINIDYSGKITLATKSAQLVGAMLAPRLVSSVLENIMPGNKNINEAYSILQDLNAHVVEKVIERLARTGSPEVIEVLQMLPQKQNKRIYLKIIWACGEIGAATALDFIIDAMQHRDAMIRARACFAMGSIGDASGYFALMRRLDDDVPAVKEQALIGIGKLCVRSALKKIESIANDLNEDIHVRHIAREVLEQIKSTESKD